MTLLKGLQHALACLGETRCSDREGHALAEKALAAAIASAESAPAVVTAEEIGAILHGDPFGPSAAKRIAALVAERTAAAVAAARREEREAAARVADDVTFKPDAAMGTRMAVAVVARRIRERGQSEAPAVAPLRGEATVTIAVQADGHGGWDVTEPVSALCIAACETREDAERVAAMLRAVAARLKP